MPHPSFMPIELAEVIATHRTMFGDATMMAEEPEKKEAPEDQDDAKSDSKDGFKSEHSKESVLADLTKERTARQALEAKVQKLEGNQAVLDKLGEVFGKDGEKPSAEKIPDWAAELIRERDESRAEKARLAQAKAVAKESGITDSDDIDLIASLPDEAAMKIFATRLTQAAKPGTPKPDRSAGLGGGDNGKQAAVQSGRDLWRDMHPTTK